MTLAKAMIVPSPPVLHTLRNREASCGDGEVNKNLRTAFMLFERQASVVGVHACEMLVDQVIGVGTTTPMKAA